MTLDDIEAEVRQPPPRTVRTRGRVYFGLGFTFCTGVVIPVLCLSTGIYFQSLFHALKSHGAATTGRIVELEPAQDKNASPHVRYEFVVAGKAYQLWSPVDRETFSKLAIGQQAEVLYLIDRPQIHGLASIVRSTSLAPATFFLWMIAGIFALFMIPSWLWLVHTQRGRLRLVTYGLAVRTTRLSFGRSAYWPHMGGTTRVYYEFPVDGHTATGSMLVFGDVVRALRGQNCHGTVLYDPADPKKSLLYPAVKPLYRIALTHQAGASPI